MSKNRDEKSVAERRDFLKLATVGTVLGGAALAAGGTAKAAAGSDEPAKVKGYQETEHVKTYYNLARF